MIHNSLNRLLGIRKPFTLYSEKQTACNVDLMTALGLFWVRTKSSALRSAGQWSALLHDRPPHSSTCAT